MTKLKYSIVFATLLSAVAINAYADLTSAQKMADKYAGIAKSVNPSYAGLNADEGKAFYNREIGVEGRKVSCSSCHTANPGDTGKNIVTHKPIRPLSPVVNPKRFADLDKVQAKFEEHCTDITGKDCAPEDKANFIAYLITVTEGSKKSK
ncbi:MAG TPA: DUF1924 domain-containing protein [Methylophilaceae bacterium]|jgi:mono/diheme cytochrome c family protein